MALPNPKLSGTSAEKFEDIEIILRELVKPVDSTRIEISEGTVTVPVAASGTVEIAAGNAQDGDTVRIADTIYTFRTALTTDPATIPNEILIGATATATGANLAKAITGGDTEGTNYSTDTIPQQTVTATDATGTVTITAKVKGVDGNDITLLWEPADEGTENLTITEFAGGVDGTPGKSGQIMWNDTNLQISLGASTTAVSKWYKTALTQIS